jgi:hypothetical protein
MGQTKGSMDKDELEQRQAQRREKAQRRNEAQSLQSSNLGRGLQESPTIKENRLRSEAKHADTTEDETDAPAKKQPKKQQKKKRKADAPKIPKKRKKKNESSSSSDSDSDSGGDSDSDETATKLIPQLLELLKKDKTKRKKKKKSKKEKKKRRKEKKDSEDEESEDEKVAQKFIQSASRKPTPCSTKRRDPVEAQLNAQKRAKGVRFGINTMSFMVLLPKNYDKNTKGNDRGGMCRLVELVRGANRHGGASRAGAE